jgi:hypothetical protein
MKTFTPPSADPEFLFSKLSKGFDHGAGHSASITASATFGHLE